MGLKWNFRLVHKNSKLMRRVPQTTSLIADSLKMVFTLGSANGSHFEALDEELDALVRELKKNKHHNHGLHFGFEIRLNVLIKNLQSCSLPE